MWKPRTSFLNRSMTFVDDFYIVLAFFFSFLAYSLSYPHKRRLRAIQLGNQHWRILLGSFRTFHTKGCDFYGWKSSKMRTGMDYGSVRFGF